ncbi:hypothetical protein JW911_01965 [Candidatus Peregrinibacteria bacterium]|nr:hypothetical protein [Candidatus Peregrinibacteria bacterium]
MIKSLLLKISGSLKFFIIILCIYIIFAIFNTEIFIKSLYAFWNLFIEIIPVLILIYLLIFLSNLVLNSKKIIEVIKNASGILGYIISIIFGILSSGPIYMWYPLLSDLKEKGVKNSFIVIFLYNRAVKLPLIPMMIYYFGINYVIILTGFMIVFSVINGIVVEKFLTQKK